MRARRGGGDAAYHLRLRDPLRKERERLRRIIPRLRRDAGPVDGAAIQPRGVPVFSRRQGRPKASSASARPIAGASPTRPAGMRCRPMWIIPRRKVPAVTTRAPQRMLSPAAVTTPAMPPAPSRSSPSAVPSRMSRPRRLRQQLPHRLPVQFPVGLRARAAHRRALGPVQQLEMDPGGIGGPAHQPIQRVDLPHQMALAHPAEGRVAGHLADAVEPLGQKQGARPHARRSCRRLAAGVAAAHHHHIEHHRVHAPRYRRGLARRETASAAARLARPSGCLCSPARGCRTHLPIQNSANTRSRISSTPTRPVIRPRAERAARSPSAAISGNGAASASASAATASASAARCRGRVSAAASVSPARAATSSAKRARKVAAAPPRTCRYRDRPGRAGGGQIRLVHHRHRTRPIQQDERGRIRRHIGGEHRQTQIRRLGARQGTADALRLDLVGGLAQPGGVGQQHRHPLRSRELLLPHPVWFPPAARRLPPPDPPRR